MTQSPPKRTRQSQDRLHWTIARELGSAIVSGRHRPGDLLSGEIEASAQRRVSRTPYREAMRILVAKGLVESRPKVGTRVSSSDRWHMLDPDVLTWIFSGEPAPSLLKSLFELRWVVEPAAAEMAARRRSEGHLEIMRDALERMRLHTLQTDAGRQADGDFHAALLAASENAFIISLTNSVTAAVKALTEFKQRAKPLRRDPVPDHERVYEAIAAGRPEEARKAMSDLIRLAVMDTPLPFDEQIEATASEALGGL